MRIAYMNIRLEYSTGDAHLYSPWAMGSHYIQCISQSFCLTRHIYIIIRGNIYPTSPKDDTHHFIINIIFNRIFIEFGM